MAEKRKVEYFLLRYVPNAVREEFVNIGLVMVEDAGVAGRFADARFTANWSKVNCLDPQADVEMLAALGREITKDVAETRDLGAVRARMTQLYSNVVGISETGGCLTEDPALEIEAMAGAYFGQIRRERRRNSSAQKVIYGKMREEFERARIWELMRKDITAGEYGFPGDELTFDCGYPNGAYKMFQALAPQGNQEFVKGLAFSYAEFAGGFLKRENKKCLLRAIVDDNLNPTDRDVEFAMATMDQYGIEVSPLSELPELAERARVELRA